MAERGDPQVLRLVVILLRSKVRMKQEDFAREARTTQSWLSKHENGLLAPQDDVLRRYAKAAGVEWHLVGHLIRFVAAILEAADRRQIDPVDRKPLETALLSLMPLLIQEEQEPEPPGTEELLEEARDIWSALKRQPPADRWKHLATAPQDACRSWSLLGRVISEASMAAAEQAPDLAELALLAAGREAAPGSAGVPPAFSGSIGGTPAS